jgi:predicted GIY-YIG superfamily endonuclease
MMWVYLLRSVNRPKWTYSGLADDPDERLKAHNAGKSPFTARFRPWKMVLAMRFEDDRKAVAFERYLKTGAGYSFARRHFW